MNIREKAKAIYDYRPGRWGLHVGFWLFTFLLRYYISMISLNAYRGYPQAILLNCLYTTVNSALAYYCLVYGIYDRLWRKKRYWMAILAIILLIIAYTSLDHLGEMVLLQDPRFKAILMQQDPVTYAFLQEPFSVVLLKRVLSLGIVFQLFFVLSLPLLIKITIAYTRGRVRSLELEKQNMQLELSFLKSQVNPHFLFNTLNNIYSLILHDKKDQSADMVARLSAFMRYTLHDASAERVPADKELKLMSDYIALERIRLNHTLVRSHFATEGSSHLLPPLLFIPLLENAFKYVIDSQDSFIDITLNMSQDRMQFVCRNSFDPANDQRQEGGIGLSNVHKRLEQYYPGKYSCVIGSDNAIYSVNLSIDLL